MSIYRKISSYAALIVALLAGPSAYSDDARNGSGEDTPASSVPTPPPQPFPAMLVAHPEKGLLLSIAYAGRRLVAVGAYGDIVISEDGSRWTQVPSPVDVTLTAVAFADDTHGWAVGHDTAILATADGGQTWTLQNYQPDLNVPLFSVLALDQRHAIATGAFGTVKITDDGGNHWQDVDDPAVGKEKLHLNAITRLADGELFMVGERGYAAISLDGRSWRKLQSPYDGSFFGVLPWGERGAIAFGLRGNIYAIVDAQTGQWTKISSPTTSSLFGGIAGPDGETVLVGNDGMLVALDRAGRAGRVPTTSSAHSQASAYTAAVGSGDGLIAVGQSGVVHIAFR